jgi:hypothetical protein
VLGKSRKNDDAETGGYSGWIPRSSSALSTLSAFSFFLALEKPGRRHAPLARRGVVAEPYFLSERPEGTAS